MSNIIHCRKHDRRYLPPYTCKQCDKEAILLQEIENVEARFYTFTLHERVEQDFAWVVTTLKGLIRNGKVC